MALETRSRSGGDPPLSGIVVDAFCRSPFRCSVAPAAWRLDQGLPADREIASAKVYASEMLARVTDEAIRIHGGMGLMSDLPLVRFWRDARVERIWDGTSGIQRHIIGRDLLRRLGA